MEASLKLYEVPGYGMFWYDPEDPNLPKSAIAVEDKKEPEVKAAKPRNKAAKVENK